MHGFTAHTDRHANPKEIKHHNAKKRKSKEIKHEAGQQERKEKGRILIITSLL